MGKKIGDIWDPEELRIAVRRVQQKVLKESDYQVSNNKTLVILLLTNSSHSITRH